MTLFFELYLYTALQNRTVLLHTSELFLPGNTLFILFMQTNSPETGIGLLAKHGKYCAFSSRHAARIRISTHNARKALLFSDSEFKRLEPRIEEE